MARLTFIITALTLIIAGVYVWLQISYDPTKGAKLAASYLRKATKEINDGDLVLARENLDVAIEIEPNLHEAHYQRAVLNLKSNKLEEAITDFSSVVRIEPTYEKAYESRGVSYYLLNDYEKATIDFETLQKLNSALNDDIRSYLGMSYYHLHRYEEAIEELNNFLRIPGKQNDEEILIHLASSFFFNGDHDRALKEVEKLISLREDNFHAYNLRGLIFRKQEKTRLALLSFKKAMEIKRDFPDVYHNIGLLVFEAGKYGRSLIYFSEAIKLFKPTDRTLITAYRNRANVFLTLKNYTLAIEDYSKIIELKEEEGFEHVSMYYMKRGRAHENNGDRERALKDFNLVIEKIPENDGALVQRGEFYAQKKEWGKAIADFKKAIEKNPNFAYCFFRLSTIYEMDMFKGKEEENLVLEYAKKAMELQPDDELYSERVDSLLNPKVEE